MLDSFKYLFRFCCDPGFNDAEELASLKAYVDAARIDDVMVFANVEEINTGHTTPQEQDVYMGLMKRVRGAVGAGVTMSVNHWPSLMHGDYGKGLREGQDFRLMVDPYGREAALCVCPLCEHWQSYLVEIYRRYAGLEPAYLWIEDDFRFHNHDPLTWGGCFCDEHMKLYSTMAGKALTRQEFVAGILQPGKPHPYRKIWLDACRDTMVALAKRLGRAVHAQSPGTHLSLMSSDPRVHCAEGRDWPGVLRGLACGNAPVNRVHLPCYAEVAPSKYMMRFNMVSMLNRAFIPPETEVYPELENYPYSRFAKSIAFTRFELMSAAPLNMSGITIDLYDLEGNGIVCGEGYQDMLAEAKDFMTDLTDGGVFRRKPGGVHVMASPLSSYVKHTAEGRSMEELYSDDMFFAALLPAYGIPFTYCVDPGIQGKIVAISGQYLRNLEPGQIEALFRHNFAVLNGDAAETLLDMGLGSLAGMKAARWARQNEGEFTYEQVCDGKEYCGKVNARATAMMVCSDALFVDYAGSPRILSQFHDSFRRATAPCLTLAGENVLVLPFGRFGASQEPPQGLLNNIRQALLQGVLSEAGARFDAPPVLEGAPYLFPYYYVMETGFALYVVNASTDGQPSLRIRTSRRVGSISALRAGNRRETAVAFTEQGGSLLLDLSVAAMECVLLSFYEAGELPCE